MIWQNFATEFTISRTINIVFDPEVLISCYSRWYFCDKK